MSELDDIEGLAAEFALGSLTAEERAGVVARRSRELVLDKAIQEWEARLAPLLHAVPPAAPPPIGLAQALSRIIEGAAPQSAEIISLRRGRNAWRYATAGVGALAASLAIALSGQFLTPSRTVDYPHVAVLTKNALPSADEPTTSTAPVFLISYESSRRELYVRQVSGRRPPSGKAYELWLMPGEGRWLPFSLGLLAAGAPVTRLAIPPRMEPELVANDLVVSLEPEKGAAPGSAMGPAVSAGRLTSLLR